MNKLANVAKNSLKRGNFPVMAGKILLRLREKRQDATEWCRANAEPCGEYLQALDPGLWQETLRVTRDLGARGEAKLAAIGLDMGGGGNYELLYFLARRLKPGTVVETGVAAGWSSQAILEALRANANGGRLWSSDFPYFRYDNPERLIGCVVDEELKNGWHLYIDGDRANLKRILRETTAIDLFHYDSDKSYAGREFAIGAVGPRLSANAAVIFDDIQDNFHFRDYVGARNVPWKVFEFGGKFVGLVGGPLTAA